MCGHTDCMIQQDNGHDNGQDDVTLAGGVAPPRHRLMGK